MELVRTKHSTLDITEYDGAARIVEALRDTAETMPFDSELRALALRSATRWDRVVQAAPARLAVVPDAGEES